MFCFRYFANARAVVQRMVTAANVFSSDKCYIIRLFTFQDLYGGVFSVLKRVVTPKSAPSADCDFPFISEGN